MASRCEHVLFRSGGDDLTGATVEVGHVAVAPAGACLREDEAQFADEARGQAAGLDELQEDGDGRAHITSGH